MAGIDLRRIKQDLAHIESERAKLEKLAENFRGILAYYEKQAESQDISTTPGKELKDAIVRILETEGKPLHPKTIHSRLVERGIKVPGQKPINNVRAHMSGDRRCIAMYRDGLWGLKHWQKPIALTPNSNGLQPTQAAPV